MVLTNSPAITTLPAVDLKRAKQFYQKMLGFKTKSSNQYVAMIECGKRSQLMIYQRNATTRADHTVVTFPVKKLEFVMEKLRKRGVEFEEYDMPGLRTSNGIAVMGKELSAWFKDSEGNILCLHETIKK